MPDHSDYDSDTTENIGGHDRRITPGGVLRVCQVGPVTVIGFDGQDVAPDFNIAEYRDAIWKLLEENKSDTVTFDVTGVVIVPSGMLGLWASLHKCGKTVEILNPSRDIREVLEITSLDSLFRVRYQES